MSYKSANKKCLTRVCHKTVKQECLTRALRDSVKQGCPTRVSPQCVNSACLTSEFVGNVTNKYCFCLQHTCRHSGSWASSCSFLSKQKRNKTKHHQRLQQRHQILGRHLRHIPLRQFRKAALHEVGFRPAGHHGGRPQQIAEVPVTGTAGAETAI